MCDLAAVAAFRLSVAAAASAAAAVAVGRAVTALYAARERERAQARWRRETQLRLNEFWKVTCIHIFPWERQTLATSHNNVLPSSRALWILCLADGLMAEDKDRCSSQGCTDHTIK